MAQDGSLDSMVEQCRRGRPEGFAWLLEQYGGRLFGYFRRRTGSEVEAEDLLQELFVRLIERIKDYRHEGKFESWLFRVAANLARDRARRRLREPGLFSQFAGEGGRERPGQVAREPGPDEAAMRAEERGQLAKALESLNELDREIILLRHFGQLSFKEIAEHFRMPIGTALAKVHRGLKLLRKIMVHDEE